MNSEGKELLKFKTRLHGHNAADGSPLNCLTDDGETPTGLSSFDLNSPESNPISYGPYPVNRVVQGFEGNMKIVIQNNIQNMIRDGILMHTGEWKNWNPSEPMPNSEGCIHTHPTDCREVWQILVHDLGVEVRTNTGGKLPYPYKQQGIISVEQID